MGWDRETAKLLLRRTTADEQLRGEKPMEKLRAEGPNRAWGFKSPLRHLLEQGLRAFTSSHLSSR
jgi:hypothetical protein